MEVIPNGGRQDSVLLDQLEAMHTGDTTSHKLSEAILEAEARKVRSISSESACDLGCAWQAESTFHSYSERVVHTSKIVEVLERLVEPVEAQESLDKEVRGVQILCHLLSHLDV
jgi:hypothetical protein